MMGHTPIIVRCILNERIAVQSSCKKLFYLWEDSVQQANALQIEGIDGVKVKKYIKCTSRKNKRCKKKAPVSRGKGIQALSYRILSHFW
ncbi:hypothetical protein CJ483_13155 [Bacillus sp. PK3_68]|nr:hypothetical protein CJ483_13155 [Bacillus sp. PK3_68]